MRVDRLEIEVDDGNRLVWDRSLDHDSPSEYVARVMERRSIKLLDVCCEDEPDRELRWRRSTGVVIDMGAVTDGREYPPTDSPLVALELVEHDRFRLPEPR